MSSIEKKHHFLVAGEVIFITKDENGDEVHSVRLNALVTNKSNNTNFPMRMLAKAQQALQAHLARKMDNQLPAVQDVVIQNICHLGYMTDEEFSKEPNGMKMQEVSPDVLN